MNEFVSYRNAKIHFSDVGKGDAVVLLHGFLEDISMWEEIQKELVLTHRIICIDLLGHGKSDCLGYIHTMEAMSEVVQYVLNKLKIDAAMFVGHSMGGYVALAVAESNSAIVNGVCLLNSTAQSDSEERKKNRERVIRMARSNYQALVSMSINNLFSREIKPQFLLEIEKSKKVALQTNVQSYIACSEGMKQRNNREFVLTNGLFKKLIVTGEKDIILPYASVVEEAKRTKTTLVTLSNGHMSYIENLPDLIVVLKNFLFK